MVIAVASGKGGTGKTTIAANLALSLQNVNFLDCDVEEPNAHLFLKPKITHTRWVSIPVPKVNEKRCSYCGRCAEVCAYSAVAVVKEKVLIFSELCHGCGGCKLLCPEGAIQEVNRPIGILESGKAGPILFAYGKLNVGEARASPVVRAVKGAHSEIDLNNSRAGSNNKITIIDVPPGTSCPMVESVKGSDFCLLTTEPTPFGLSDLTLAVGVVRKLKVPLGVVINRDSIGDGKVDDYCRRENIPILMRVPMDRDIAMAYSRGTPLIEAKPEYKKNFLKLYERIKWLTSAN